MNKKIPVFLNLNAVAQNFHFKNIFLKVVLQMKHLKYKIKVINIIFV